MEKVMVGVMQGYRLGRWAQPKDNDVMGLGCCENVVESLGHEPQAG